MERRDAEVETALDPRALIRMNALIELEFLLKALIYQHKYGNIKNEDNE